MAKISITGGTGFIGRKLVRAHLDRGDDVRVLTRDSEKYTNFADNLQLFKGDLRSDSSALKSFVEGTDILYHCAGEIRDPSKMEQTNILGTQNLIAASKRYVGRWVQLSSVGVYGPRRNGLVDECEPCAPVGPYEMSKARSDHIVLQAAQTGDIALSVLRPSNVFGSEMSAQYLFQLISTIEKGLFFYIGEPGTVFSGVHVDNVVNALILCGTKESSNWEIYNLSDELLLEEFVRIIAGKLKKREPTIRVPEKLIRFTASRLERLPGFPLTKSRIDALTTRTIYSSNKIKARLGYRHLVSIEEGIEEIVRARSWVAKL